MKKPEKKPNTQFYGGKGVAIATAAAILIGAGPTQMESLTEGLKRGEIALYLSTRSRPDIDISQMDAQEKNFVEVLRAWASVYPTVPVYVATNANRDVCQVNLTPEEIHQLAQVPVPHTRAALNGKSEKLAAARNICAGRNVVPGSVQREMMEGKPYSVVAPEGRVAMEPLIVTPKIRG